MERLDHTESKKRSSQRGDTEVNNKSSGLQVNYKSVDPERTFLFTVFRGQVITSSCSSIYKNKQKK